MHCMPAQEGVAPIVQHSYAAEQPVPRSAGLGSVPISVDLQPGVAASEDRDRTRADCLQESPAGFNFRDPET
eukprot:9668820-Alexandrium_andersonii.AAC.1